MNISPARRKYKYIEVIAEESVIEDKIVSAEGNIKII